jgi:hypothetical protein
LHCAVPSPESQSTVTNCRSMPGVLPNRNQWTWRGGRTGISNARQNARQNARHFVRASKRMGTGSARRGACTHSFFLLPTRHSPLPRPAATDLSPVAIRSCAPCREIDPLGLQSATKPRMKHGPNTDFSISIRVSSVAPYCKITTGNPR